MKSRPFFFGRLLLPAVALISFSGSARAATFTWNGTTATDANWTTTTNWTANGTPGLINPAAGSLSSDTVIFSSAITTYGGSANPILNDANRDVKFILFDTATAGAYVIGTAGGNILQLSHGGNVTVGTNVTAAQTINAPISLRLPSSTAGVYSFINNATNSSGTLTINGSITSTAASTRGFTITLDGINTGNNLISGQLLRGAGPGSLALVKQGVGTWILSADNGGATGLSVASIISAGTLVAQHNNALGTAVGTTVNGGTLRLDNGITLGTASIALNNTGAISANNGTGIYNNTVTVAASSGVTLAAVGSSDVLSLGNAVANKYTGGAGAVTTISGAGTVFLTGANNYAGTFAINSGVLKLGNATALGSTTTAGVTFGASSTGKLQLNGNSVTLASLSTNATVGTPTIENNNGTAATLTVSNTSGTSTYGGVIQNGATGTLALTKTGASTLTLSGNTNTYSGATSISAGILNVTNISGSATGTGTVSLGSATLTGAGRITGALTTTATSIIMPGTVTAGNAGAGTLTLGNITLVGSTTINYGLVAGNASANYISAGLLTLPSSGTVLLNLYTPNTATAFTAAPGTYNLFSYTSLAGGAVSTAFSLGTSVAGYTPSFGISGGFVQLTLTAAGMIGTWTNGTANSNWSNSGNWDGGVPSSAGDSAVFTSNPGLVNLDANETVGGVSFNNASGYTLTGANTLTLDNSGSGATMDVTAGSHDIQAAVALNDNLTATAASGSQLTLSGVVSQASGTRSLIKNGAGTLVLSNALNSFSGGIAVNNGTLKFTSFNALGAGSALSLGSLSTNGTLQYATGNTADVSSLAVTFNAGGATIDTNGNDVTFANAVGNSGAGGLTKDGLGTLSLAAGNTYTGANTLVKGTLNIAADTSLGAVPGSAQTNVTFNPGAGNSATLQAGTSITLNANRSLVFSTGTGVIDTQANTVTLTGASSGSGILGKTGSGNLTVASTQGYTGGTSVLQGTLQINFGGSLAGNISLANGTTFRLQAVSSNSSFVGNNISVAAGASTTFVSSVTGNGYSGNLTSGDANSVILVTGGAQGFNFSASNVKQFTGFTGTVNVVAGSSMDSRGTTNNNGGDNTIFQIDGFVSSKNGGNWAFGALTGASTGNLGGAVTYTVGAKGVDSAYAGNITTSATTGLVKTGGAKLTLTGTGNTYLATTISGGTLQIGDGGTAGTLGTGLVTNNAALAFNRSDSVTVANGITGSGTVSIIGTGTTALTAANGYTGLTTISGGGTLNINGQFALGGAVYGGTIFNNGTLQYATAFSGNGAGDITQNSVGAAKNVTLTGNATIDTNGNDVSYASTFGNGGAGSLTKSGAGSLTLAAASTYTGGTVVKNGSLVLDGGTDRLLGTGSVVIGDVSTTGKLVLGGTTVADQTLVGLTTTGSGGSVVGGNSSNSTLTLNIASGTNTFGGSLGGAGSNEDKLALSKVGAGTLILSGINTYTGTTTVSNGTLALGASGAIDNSPVIKVASGATLDVSAVSGWAVGASTNQKLTGSGGVTGAATIGALGTHNAGDAAVNAGVGAQAFSSSLTYASNSIFDWDLNANSTASGFDTVSAVGNIDVSTTGTVFNVIFGAGVDLNNSFWKTPNATQTWSMASIFGKDFNTGSFASVVSTADPLTQGSFTINGSNLTWTAFSAVPEPSSALAGLLVAAGLLRRRRA